MEQILDYYIIKAYMMAQKVEMLDIAKELDTSRQMVWRVIKGINRHGFLTAQIRNMIAKKCQLDYKYMWGEDDPLWHDSLIKNKRKRYKRKRKRGTRRTRAVDNMGKSTPSGSDTGVSEV